LPALSRIIDAIAELAPWDLAESWDQVGLQVGNENNIIHKILVSLDYNQQTLEEGLDLKVDGFIVHHPLIFKPIKQLTNKTEIERLLIALIKHDLFLIAAHTNVDKAREGLNQYLAELLNLENIKPLNLAETVSYKVVVFSPESYVEPLRKAMSRAGAGIIGDYRQCSFESPGTGVFMPESNARPFTGTPGVLERTSEIRLEMVAEKRCLSDIIKAIIENHPYQEPAFDIFPLANPSLHGLGRIGDLKQSVSLEEFCRLIKKKLSCKDLRVAGDLSRPVKRVALCSGSGGNLLFNAINAQADLYLTGELDYHDFYAARGSGLAVIAAGHWGTEHCFADLITNHLNAYFKFEKKFEVIKGKSQEEPYLTF
jgi:dinuclear metal center YbgI/SA1388 family protein